MALVALIEYYISKAIKIIMNKSNGTSFFNKIILPIAAVWSIDPKTKFIFIYVAASLLGNFCGYGWYTLYLLDLFIAQYFEKFISSTFDKHQL